MIDWSDPHGPLFCPCNFLLSVGIHLTANIDDDTWVAAVWAQDIIKSCYMEVMYERKYGLDSEQARMAACLRLALLDLLHDSDRYTIGRSNISLPNTPDRLARTLLTSFFPVVRRVAAWFGRTSLDRLPHDDASHGTAAGGNASPAHKREWWG
jgi:hypothetical protein